jgi:hypothetical protein
MFDKKASYKSFMWIKAEYLFVKKLSESKLCLKIQWNSKYEDIYGFEYFLKFSSIELKDSIYFTTIILSTSLNYSFNLFEPL